MLITPLILAGGSGTRLWPASRESRPKQFLPLFGPRSSFQKTLLRVAEPDLFGRPVVIGNRGHQSLAESQLGEIGLEADLVLEPEARDSGPAIAAGAALIAARDGADAVVLSLAADHAIRDVEGFRADCRLAMHAARAGCIVTFGIEPTFPATQYGYIEPGAVFSGAAMRVSRFVEKPDQQAAESYLREGYLWNSGNFVFEARTLLEEYALREPQTIDAVMAAVAGWSRGGSPTLDGPSFARAERRSIDYAVMENTAKAAILRARFDWSDIGSWDAVRDLLPQDDDGNAARGPSAFVDARNNITFSDGPRIAIVGLEDLAVIATPDAVLVARRSDAAGVKRLAEYLKSNDGSPIVGGDAEPGEEP